MYYLCLTKQKENIMKTFIATYKNTSIEVKAENLRSAYYEAKNIFTDAHWSEVSIYKVK